MYKDLIQDMKVEPSLKEALIKFLEKIEDKEETEEFNTFMDELMNLLVEQETLNIKAEAYDKLREIEENYQNDVGELREEYKAYEETGGKNIPVPLNPQETVSQIK
jgi:hypothetical protein